MLNWTQQKLADAAGVRISAVISFELGWRVPAPERIQAIQRALEEAGIEFIMGDEPGVKVKAKGERK